MSKAYAPFGDIIKTLEQHITGNDTGCFFIATSTNKLARIWLDKGKIVNVDYAYKRGAEAVFLMTQIVDGRFRFEPESHTPSGSGEVFLPDTKQILQVLSGSSGSGGGSGTKGVSDTNFSADTKRIMLNVLKDIIGPMANIICDEVFAQCEDKPNAMRAFAQELDEEDFQLFVSHLEREGL